MNTKPDDTARKLVYHDQNPMCSQACGFAAEQIAAPQAVLHVAEKREPRWTSRIRFWSVMNPQNAANHIFVDLDAERQRDLLRNSGTAPGGITAFHLDHSVDELLLRSLGARPTPAVGRKQQAALSFPEHVVEMQQSGRLQNDSGAENAWRAHEKGAQTGEDAIRGAQVGRTLAAAIENQQLMPDQGEFGNHGTEASRPCQPDDDDDQMNEKEMTSRILAMVSIPHKPTTFSPIW